MLKKLGTSRLGALLILVSFSCSPDEPGASRPYEYDPNNLYSKIAESALSTRVLVNTSQTQALFGSPVYVTVTLDELPRDGERASFSYAIENDRELLIGIKMSGLYSLAQHQLTIDDVQALGPRSKARLWLSLQPNTAGKSTLHVRLGDEWVEVDSRNPALAEPVPFAMSFNDLERRALGFAAGLKDDQSFQAAYASSVGKKTTPDEPAAGDGTPGSETANVRQPLCGDVLTLAGVATAGASVASVGLAGCVGGGAALSPTVVLAVVGCLGGAAVAVGSVIKCTMDEQHAAEAKAFCDQNCPITQNGPSANGVCGNSNGCWGQPGTCVSPTDYCCDTDACKCPPAGAKPADGQCFEWQCEPNPARWIRRPINDGAPCDLVPGGPGQCNFGGCFPVVALGCVMTAGDEGPSNCDGYDNDCDLEIDEGCCPEGETICGYQPFSCSKNEVCSKATAVGCAHNECQTGAALAKSCSACAGEICIGKPECCDPAHGWTADCVEAAQNLPGPCVSRCYDGKSSCPHNECMDGSAMPTSCSSCAASICKRDVFCCTGEWDKYCTWEAAQDPYCKCQL